MQPLDHDAVSKIKDAEFLRKALSEVRVAERKCSFYAGLASDPEVKKAFQAEHATLQKAVQTLENQYDTLKRG